MIYFLIGYMGCGKTTIGKMVAKKKAIPFIDMDRHIEREAGMTIREIFQNRGEDYFRMLESRFLQGVEPVDGDLIVATGGGSPCFGENMDIIKSRGISFYIRMKPEKLAERVRNGRDKRPLLKDKDDRELLEFIRRTLAGREDYYSRADHTVECDGLSDSDACSLIIELIENK